MARKAVMTRYGMARRLVYISSHAPSLMLLRRRRNGGWLRRDVGATMVGCDATLKYIIQYTYSNTSHHVQKMM